MKYFDFLFLIFPLRLLMFSSEGNVSFGGYTMEMAEKRNCRALTSLRRCCFFGSSIRIDDK